MIMGPRLAEWLNANGRYGDSGHSDFKELSKSCLKIDSFFFNRLNKTRNMYSFECKASFDAIVFTRNVLHEYNSTSVN